MPTTETPPRPSETRVTFDLNDVLRPDEIERFKEAARQAGAKSLTEHFIKLTLALPSNNQPAA